VGAAAAAVLTISSAPSATAGQIPDHHTITCDTASFYAHYAIGSGPFDFVRTLYKGKDIGHTYGKQEEINGWAYSQDFGPNDWGYVEMACF
jgi:hypothetical protein